jgi:cytochrome c-type biogenesis protein CcmH/NrfG
MRHGLRIGLVLLLATGSAQAKANPDFDKGLQFKKDGMFAQAAKVFSGIVSKDPKDADALVQLATLQGWLEKYDESIKTWEAALELAPKSADFRLGLARVLYWKKDYSRASSELKTVLRASPKLVEGWTLLGDVYAASARSPETLKAYLKAQELAPDDAEIAKKVARTQAAKP